jgi:hypothetical protein
MEYDFEVGAGVVVEVRLRNKFAAVICIYGFQDERAVKKFLG